MKRKKYFDVAEKNAMSLTFNVWRFCAYKSENDYINGNHYFIKDFLDHSEMKEFSGEHSFIEKSNYPEYCSMYWQLEL